MKYKCEECGLLFRSLKFLRLHRRRDHKIED